MRANEACETLRELRVELLGNLTNAGFEVNLLDEVRTKQHLVFLEFFHSKS